MAFSCQSDLRISETQSPLRKNCYMQVSRIVTVTGFFFGGLRFFVRGQVAFWGAKGERELRRAEFAWEGTKLFFPSSTTSKIYKEHKHLPRARKPSRKLQCLGFLAYLAESPRFIRSNADLKSFPRTESILTVTKDANHLRIISRRPNALQNRARPSCFFNPTVPQFLQNVILR